MSKTMRLERLLSNLGYGTRSQMAAEIRAGAVSIRDTIIKDPSYPASIDDAHSEYITLHGVPIDPPHPFTIMFHKPVGYTCSHDDPGFLVYDLLPRRWVLRKPKLSTIGRLDKDSSGQLLLTDDGDLLHRIISPRHDTPKRYAVTLRDDLKGDEAKRFGNGDFMLPKDAKPLKPAQWVQDGPKSGIMILSEGRFRQIRRMFEVLGNEVLTLHRFQTGGLKIGNLPEGKWIRLSSLDIDQIFKGQS